MNIYRRYFRVETGPLIDAVNKARQINRQANEQYKQLLQEIGAKPSYYQRDGQLVSILFETEPDKSIYRKADNGWYPKQNNKQGCALHKRIKAIETRNEAECLSEIGLDKSYPYMLYAGTAYFATLLTIPYESIVCIVTMPWYDEDPEKIKQYIKDKDSGVCYDSSMDTLLWQPTADMIEVKEWQVKKEVDEWNESVKKDKAA